MKKRKPRSGKKGILSLVLSFCMIIGMTCGAWAADTAETQPPSEAVTEESISLEYWITNFEVYGTTGKTEHTKRISKSMEGIQTEEGVELETVVPKTAYSFFDGTVTVYYWQAMCLDATHRQTNASGDDETGNGTTMTRIRYYNGAWQYRMLNQNWQYLKQTDQLVAYYLQKTDVTKEIETYAKDWGYSTDGTTPNTSNGKGQVALSVAVVYPDGTVSPSETNMYGQSTTIFNYWSGRDIGIVAPVNNSDYNISKITVTNGKRSSNSGNVWYKNDSIQWEKKTNEAGSQWYDEKEVWNQNSGTQPVVNGKNASVTWSAKNTAKLILIYLEPVQKETNLNVRYMDDSDHSVIKSYQIAMTYQQGDPAPDFVTALQQTSDVHTGTITLDEDAYVVNSASVKQTFNRDISVMTDIDGKYSSGLYQYMGADISEDGKTLTLHYDFDTSKLSKTYVIDFGRPVEIPISELVVNADARISEIHADDAHKEDITIGSDYTITYCPSEILKQTDVVRITVTYSGGSQDIFKIGFTPASNVMYEETVFGLSENSDWSQIGTTTGGTQVRELLGQENLHGFDPLYQADQTFSGAHAYQAQLSLESGSFAKTETAEFSFHGTGFDLISECGTNTGMLMVVVRDNNGKAVRSYLVDTYFSGSGSSLFAGKTGVLDYQVPVVRCMDLPQGTYQVSVSGCLTSGSGVVSGGIAVYAANVTAEPEQIAAEVVKQLKLTDVDPLEVQISYMDEDSVLAGNKDGKNQQVERKGAVNMSADAMSDDTATVYLDGVRIYHTLNQDDAYIDSEQNVSYGSVYDYIKNSLDETKEWTGQSVVYMEYDGAQDAYTISDYQEKGPENEVYLTPGSQIAFVLSDYQQGDTVQIAAKAVSDAVQVTGFSDIEKIDTAAEMYYPVTPQYDEQKDLWYVRIGSLQNSEGLLSLSACKLSDTVTPKVNAAFAQYVLEQANTTVPSAPSQDEQITTDKKTDQTEGSSEATTPDTSGNAQVVEKPSEIADASNIYVDTIRKVITKIWKSITQIRRWRF